MLALLWLLIGVAIVMVCRQPKKRSVVTAAHAPLRPTVFHPVAAPPTTPVVETEFS